MEDAAGTARRHQLDDVPAGHHSGHSAGAVRGGNEVGNPAVGTGACLRNGITAAELAAGLVLNVWLGLGVWDYSGLWGNFLGQVCPQFRLLWCFGSIPSIVILDWLRYAVEGGERPRYNF